MFFIVIVTAIIVTVIVIRLVLLILFRYRYRYSNYIICSILQISSNEPENDVTDLMTEESANISVDTGGIIMFSFNRMLPFFSRSWFPASFDLFFCICCLCYTYFVRLSVCIFINELHPAFVTSVLVFLFFMLSLSALHFDCTVCT